jgi:hypothetical protein
MLKKTIKYTDYNDNEREEDFYFNLTESELAEMEFTTSGGMEELVKKITAEQDTKELFKLFKQIITKSVGIKDLDGKHFRKSQQISDDFLATGAYNELFLELMDAEEAAAFIKGILPKNVDTTAARAEAAKVLNIPERDTAPAK